MAIVLHHSRLNGAQKLLLLGVANHDGDGGAYPSQLRLATYCGVSDLRNLRRLIDKCVASGELTVTDRGGGKVNTPEHNRTNLYTINVSCPPNCDRTAQHRLLCWGCDEPLPFARYRAEAPAGLEGIGWHKRCAERAAAEATQAAQPVDNYPGANSPPPGEYAPHPRANTPYEPTHNQPIEDSMSAHEVDVRAREAVDSECIGGDEGEHEWAMHRGQPWRCTGCGIAWEER